ncbi:outer membrane protein OmpK [Colwellia psychrerythraea]|uniref:Nucleoside-specific channel-forming protein, Tsx-like protein n=1 Tax=Colwellia psychrerythraea TaxID=28229 RepID=A0A099KXQ8_COLPS|nr:outer membrane protein OmpK [Colwellia psychrerythraea]KGJ94607.1 Nucleoside-specific channel-forming protein, Tsx-like protein [Colwellia psychrerythraea]
MKISAPLTALALTAALNAPMVSAEIWGNTEVQLQALGELERPGTGGTADTTIITFQHAGGWEYGDNFFFMDYSRYSVNNDANFPVADSSELYGEWYSNFSLGAISGNDLSFGPVKDIGVVAGFNFAPEVDSAWVLPGVRFALDLPGFAFAQIDVTGYIHQGGGSADSPVFTVVDEDSSFMVDFAWAYPFKIGSTSWSIEGHLEYIDGRTQVNNFGTTELESWILFQPQIRLDLGEVLGQKAQRLFVGIEYQYWKNKLGEKGTDDNTAQFLAVWRF